MGLVALGGALLVVVATARAARTPGVARPADPVVAEHLDMEPAADPLWTLAADPIERIGYRHGRRHTLEVVPLGPTAIEVELRTAGAFLEMRAAAALAGVELRLESGFRTVEEQRALYKAWRNRRGNKAARPGSSNHQSGRALDIAVISEPGALAWLETNAASFGFKRTVKSEPWHWEYVDVPIARGMTKRAGKAAKRAKAVAKRPARRPGSVGKSGHRVASSRR
ncbi:MAG TPA: D-alanyl-D-alanine carboxypeptidase family protein [Kofleriaceae bacterium]